MGESDLLRVDRDKRDKLICDQRDLLEHVVGDLQPQVSKASRQAALKEEQTPQP